MLVPSNWLNKYVSIENEDMKALENKLIMSGSNTEGTKNYGDNFENVVIGKILSIKNHPNADKLLIMDVTVGEEELQIVTGAQNCSEGDLVPVALHGSKIVGGQKIKKGKLRGEVSEGMLCSLQELGFNKSVIPEKYLNGIYILNGEYTVGENIKEALHLEDTVIEFEITPNRPDCLSVLGMARETGATLGTDIKLPDTTIETSIDDISNYVDVTIEAEELCSRYAARVAKEVEIKESPTWMQISLMKAGVRPINNIVDITNYVMLENGQPIHAFDYDKLDTNHITIRRAKAGETLVTLDDVERKLTAENLVITDGETPVALAGVMGGDSTEVCDQTKNILIEVANFNSSNIRETSKQFGLRSESSSRFEKGISPSKVDFTMARICNLVEKLAGGEIVKGVVDRYPVPVESKEIKVRTSRVNALLGTALSAKEMAKYMNSLEIKTKINEDHLLVEPPLFRLDLNKEIDFVEEIARIYGYENIGRTLPKGNTFGGKPVEEQLEDKVAECLIENGVNEITTYSFIRPSILEDLRLPKESPQRKYVELKNPLGEEFSMMRTTLVGNMLEVIKNNYNRKIEEAALFEIGNTFIPNELPVETLPTEAKRLVIALYGENEDFFTLKGILENLFKKLKLTGLSYVRVTDDLIYHPGKCAQIMLNGNVLGKIGAVHPKTSDNFGVSTEVFIADIDFELLLEEGNEVIKYKQIPKYPKVERDIALVVKQEVLHQEILDVIYEHASDLLEEASLFDIYEGEQIEDGYKSMAYNLVFRSNERTLEEAEVTEIYEKVLDQLEEDIDAKLR